MRETVSPAKEGGSPALEVRELQVPFGTDPGLRGVSFVVERGERFALVGASGAGKTSLLKAISGSGLVSAGQIRVLGREVTGLPPEKRGVTFLAQRPLLFPHLSVFENVAFPLRVRGVARAEIPERVQDALQTVRMRDFGTRRPQELSGGQAHRVALARAVVSRPPVLLLDEPMTSLDPSLREDVRQSILAVQEEYGPALLLVTHDLQEAGRMVDRVGVILDGGLAQVSPPDRLFRNPASPEVARFLGLPNELFGVLGSDGILKVEGWGRTVGGFSDVVSSKRTAFEGASSGEVFGGWKVVLVFGADAGRILPAGAGGFPGTLTEIFFHPQGATARVVVSPDCGGGDAPGALGTLEVSVDPGWSPEQGADVEVGFSPERMHVFPFTDP